MQSTASILSGHVKPSEEQGQAFPGTTEQGRSLKHQREDCPLNKEAILLLFLSSFYGFMIITSLVLRIPQGGDDTGKRPYSLLCTNTNQAGMLNTQINVMSHCPRRSGKLLGPYPEMPWGLASCLSSSSP